MYMYMYNVFMGPQTLFSSLRFRVVQCSVLMLVNCNIFCQWLSVMLKNKTSGLQNINDQRRDILPIFIGLLNDKSTLHVRLWDALKVLIAKY